MINFRFHLVSLIAVFLAMGLGILVGSTVVDQAIVDRLDKENKDIEREADQRKAENDRLKDELARANAYMDESAAIAVSTRLDAVPVAVVAERGVDEDEVNDTVSLLRAAGADVPGVFWLNDKWTMNNAADVAALREALTISGNAATTRTRALTALASRLTEPPVTPIAGEAPSDDVITQLHDAGFLDVDLAGDNVDLALFPNEGARALVITGSHSQLRESDATLAVAHAFDDSDAPTVVAEVFDDRDDDIADRGEAVAPVRADDVLADRVATLDDLELIQGRVTAVLALQDLANGVVGHYGYGSGATRSFPGPEQS
jgi:hypothetical protein